MASHVSHCMAKAYACRTHGKPCMWHMASHVSSCMAMLRPIYMRLGGGAVNAVRGKAASSVRGSSEEKEEEGRKGEEKGRKGKEKGRRMEEKERRKEKKKMEEERKKKEEKEGV